MYILLIVKLALCTQPLYTWKSESDMEGLMPTPRGGHSAVLIGRFMYVFGGCNTTQHCFNDLHTYNTASKTWQRLNSTGNLPSARGDHISVSLGTKILLFGGTFRGLEYNDLYEYNAVTDHWSMLLPEGEKPQSRSSCGASLDEDGNLFIIGGYSSKGYLNDVWVYSTVSNKWTRFQTSGDAPTARELSSFSIQGKIGYLFGGFHSGGVSSELYVLDIEMMNWFRAKDDGYLPEGREGHIASLSNEFLFVQGGCNFAHSACFDDLFVLDLVTLWWVKLETHSFTTRPAQKERASSVSLGSEILVFGGCYLDKHCFNDLARINTGIKCSCNGNGVCRDGVCVCFKGYSGHDCLVRAKCKENCLARGFCSSSGQCDCYPGYKGSVCEYESNCPSNCTGVTNGKCQTDGSCECNKGYSGSACECQCVNGACAEGKCICYVGWTGSKCDVEKTEDAEEAQEAQETSQDSAASSAEDSQSGSDAAQEAQTDTSNEASANATESQAASESNSTGATQAAEQGTSVSDDGQGSEADSNAGDQSGSSTGSQATGDSGCENCVHGECSEGKCYCASGYTGDNCDQMSKGVALIYASSLTLVFILFGAVIGYWCIGPVNLLKDKEEFPLIRDKSHGQTL